MYSVNDLDKDAAVLAKMRNGDYARLYFWLLLFALTAGFIWEIVLPVFREIAAKHRREISEYISSILSRFVSEAERVANFLAEKINQLATFLSNELGELVRQLADLWQFLLAFLT